MSSLKRELASDAAAAPRPTKRASPSSDSSSSANSSTIPGGALPPRIDDEYFSNQNFTDSDEDMAGPDHLPSPSSPQLPATDSSSDGMMDGRELYEDTIEDSPLTSFEKHINTNQDTQQDEAPASSSPIAKLGKALAASKGLKQSASPEKQKQKQKQEEKEKEKENEVADEGILVQPEITDATDEHLLPKLPPAQRQQFYAHLYADRIIDLQDLAQPPECRQYPQLAAEIAQAYLTHATITMAIWTNYDRYTKRFFQTASRAQDCGKICLSPPQRARVQRLLQRAEMRKIRLHIGTPFRTLCVLNLTCSSPPDEQQQRSYPLGVTGYLVEDSLYGSHNLLEAFAQRNVDNILTDGLAAGEEDDGNKRGLTLADVDEIAKDFVCRPRNYGEQQQWFFH
ncbi:Hypothetical predicted protein [Lecanosticta acicola]|uniref:Uncharacterized protein n=1 Tax=Lecanosticta acicola TaxID=111012 RepID=A0AAI8YZP2_9PEZI|nr:Hypothetical predicted protein [Lecanosticta acicola]